MAELNVDPNDLVSSAAGLADLVLTGGTALPPGWVTPAGADPISAQAVPQLNASAASLYNGLLAVLNQTHGTARKVGASAVGYTVADDQGAREIGGTGGDLATNPVAEEVPHTTPRMAPDYGLAAEPTVDSLTFAHQLHNGPGPAGASQFAENLRGYLSTTHAATTDGLDQHASVLQNWTPVGSQAAQELGYHRGLLDQLGSALGDLADGADNYSDAFTKAKAKHPTPHEIISTRKELAAAIRSKDPVATSAAMAKYNEQNARSAQTISDYTTQVGSKNATAQNSSGAASSTAASDTAGSTGTTGSNTSQMGTLAEVLPSLVSSMMQNGMAGQLGQQQGMGAGQGQLGGLESGGLGDYAGLDGGGAMPVGGLSDAMAGAGGGGGGGGAANSIPTMDAGPMGAISAGLTSAASASSAVDPTVGLSRAPVADPETPGMAAGGRPGTAGSGSGMPYMPMAPGMGAQGGSNNERNRVVAWHPDRLMYVDDTPHTEQVIGEKPSIAPQITPATPAPANPAQNNTGGNS